MGRILILGCGLVVMFLLLTMAIVAAAPYIALAAIVIGVLAYLWWIDYPAGNKDKKPP